jgi:hypothetical protein
VGGREREKDGRNRMRRETKETLSIWNRRIFVSFPTTIETVKSS